MLESHQLNKCDIAVVKVSVENAQASLGLHFIQYQPRGELACQAR